MTRRRVTAAWALSAALVLLNATPASAAGSSPWTDPDANGTVTFCDQQGHAITGGRVTDKPFVWKAVGSSPAPAPYGAAGAVAQLYMFAPIKGSDPSSWAGEAMAGASNYTDVAHPAATSTSLDIPLSVFLSDYRLLWDGYIQARLVYSRVAYGAASQYAAATIHVSGDTWQVVGARGTAPCTSGNAVSDEIVALHLPASGIAPSATASRQPTVAPTASPGQYGTADDPVTPPASSAAGPTGASASADASALSAGSDRAQTSGPWVPVALAILVIGGIGAGGLARLRRGGHR